MTHLKYESEAFVSFTVYCNFEADVLFLVDNLVPDVASLNYVKEQINEIATVYKDDVNRGTLRLAVTTFASTRLNHHKYWDQTLFFTQQSSMSKQYKSL